jgi:drug/metabolite transporter (DMT)-like permease
MTTSALSNRIDPLGYALAVGGTVLFSSKGIFIKLAFGVGVSTEMLLSLRMIVALPVYLAIMIWLLRHEKLRALLTPRNVLASMAIGIQGYYISSYLDFMGLVYLTSQYERLVLFTYPFFVVLFGVMFFGDRMVWAVVPGMLVSYLGLIIVFSWNLTVSPDGLVLGTLLVLGSAITFALYQHLAKRQMVMLGSALFTCIAMSTAGVIGISQQIFIGGLESYLNLPDTVWLLGLALGIFGTVLPSFMMNAGMARIGARATSSTAAFGPILTSIFAVLVLGEDFTWVHALGTALVLFGSYVFTSAENRSRRGSATPA